RAVYSFPTRRSSDLLLLDSIGETTFGASAAWIVSQRWDWGAIHLNAAAALTRAHHGDIFVGTIIEGPAKWTVRPVAEVSMRRNRSEEHTSELQSLTN